MQKHRSQKNNSRYINIYGLSDNNLKKSQDCTDFHEINLGSGATDVLSRVQEVAVEEEVVTCTPTSAPVPDVVPPVLNQRSWHHLP